MTNLSLILWSVVFYIQLERVFPATQSFFNEDLMAIEGNSCNSSEIKLLLIDRNVSKIHVHLTHTFYADEDLKLNGITEFQIFAKTWHCTKPVIFDLSGSDGASQEPPKVKGSPGSRGKDGKNGGNFLGLTSRTINGDYLRVISNGGNGGDGQAGSASDDIYILLNVEYDSGDSGWFSGGDLHNYYEKFFSDRGYDAEISDIDDYTSFYAVFLQDKRASFNIRLHPRKCCGTTGVGGPGGHGGKRGSFAFTRIHSSHIRDGESETTPTFVGNDGTLGKLGKNGEICENGALDVRIDVELKQVVFVVLPLHHSFSSRFTVLNHTNSSKCSPEYVRSNTTTVAKTMEPTNVDIVSSILFYKMFLLECMKNESLNSTAQDMYKDIDDDWFVNNQNSLRGLLLEACELEKKTFGLEKTINVLPIYQRLLERVERLREDENMARQYLLALLKLKLEDLEDEDHLIAQLEPYTESSIWFLNYRLEQLSPMPQFNDVKLQNLFNQLHFEVNGKFMLAKYDYIVKGLQLTHFPFAAEYLEKYDMSTSLYDYKNLEDIHSAAVNKINAVNETIRLIKRNNWDIKMNLNYIDVSRPSNALFVWKYSENSENIRKLFSCEKITLLADVKQAQRPYNAMKFKQIDWYFRSSEQNVTDRLNNALKRFDVELLHNGRSELRCNNNFYQIISRPLKLSFSFAKDKHDIPTGRLSTYDMLLNNEPMLSPYASWEIQLDPWEDQYKNRLARFVKFPIDIELHGAGKFISEGAPICDNRNLAKIYTQI